MPVRQSPGPARRARSRCALVVDALSFDGRSRRATLEASDVYGTTSIIAVEAIRLIINDQTTAGAFAAAQIFGATDFLNFLRPHGLPWQLEDQT